MFFLMKLLETQYNAQMWLRVSYGQLYIEAFWAAQGAILVGSFFVYYIFLSDRQVHLCPCGRGRLSRIGLLLSRAIGGAGLGVPGGM
jgi:hypothetical protein